MLNYLYTVRRLPTYSCCVTVCMRT